MSEITNTEEIRKIPSPENKKVTFFGNYETTNVLIIVFMIIAAVGIIVGSIGLSEKTQQKTIRNISSANFEKGSQPSGTKIIQQSDGDYVVELDYTQPSSKGGFIHYLNNVEAGTAEANKALVLDSGKGISGINSITSSQFFGQIGSGTSQSDGYFEDVDITGELSVSSKSFLYGGVSISGGLSVSGDTYIDNILVSGDLTTNSVTGQDSAVIGGNDNISTGTQSVITGGVSNQVYSDMGFVAGGFNNSVSGTSSAAIAGLENTVSGIGSGNLAGYGCLVSGQYSGNVAGQNNRVNDNAVVTLGGTGLSTSGLGTSWNFSTLTGKHNNYSSYPWDESGSQILGGSDYRFVVGSGTSDGSRNNAFSVDNVGNIYFGTDSGASIYTRTGASSYVAKAFTIQHPTITDRWLRHGCLEGPEGGVYYRGKGEAPAIISLPDYVVHIAVNFTIQITPIGEPRLMSTSEVSADGQFRVYGEGRFHWNVTGERISLEPEPLKTEVRLRNVGPYSWEY